VAQLARLGDERPLLDLRTAGHRTTCELRQSPPVGRGWAEPDRQHVGQGACLLADLADMWGGAGSGGKEPVT
jgi:hypothetical protein